MQDALIWSQVHVIGHSMGAMVAMQLACMHPERLLSLTLISATAGRWQSVPTNWAAIKYAWQVAPHILMLLVPSSSCSTATLACSLFLGYLCTCALLEHSSNTPFVGTAYKYGSMYMYDCHQHSAALLGDCAK